MNEKDHQVAELIETVMNYDEADQSMRTPDPDNLQAIEEYGEAIKEAIEELYQQDVDFQKLSNSHSEIEEIWRTIEEEKDGRKQIEYSIVISSGGERADFVGHAVIDDSEN